MAVSRLSFGPFALDAERGVLIREGKPAQLGQRAAALLQALVEAGGAPVTKTELMDRGWPGLTVEEGNLTVQIAALRKALGNGPEGHDWIITVPRLGYRLLNIRQMGSSADTSAQPSLAVLPFQDLGADSAQDWFADGVVEDIITALSRFRSFAVIARNSSFTYKGRAVDVRQVAKELGVRYVLEGSLRRAGNRLRIAAQLADGTTGAHLWAENFDGTVEDVFEFQDSITDGVASIVGSQIEAAEIRRSRLERPGSIAVYDIQLKAQATRNFTGTEKENAEAYALLTEALQLEPDNALTLAQAAWALSRRGAMGRQEGEAGDREKSVQLAHRALERANGDPMVMAYCGYVLIHMARDYDLAMAVFTTAVEANPHNLMVVSAAGVGHLHCGDVADALALFRRADRLSPRDSLAHVTLTGIAHALMVLGDYPEALVTAGRSLAANPNYLPTYWMLIAGNAHLGHMDQARHYLDAYLKVVPEASLARIRAGQPAKHPDRLATILDGLRLAGLGEG
ncbi:MAG: winged helix-turn-helix domain-containing tetratricopeptide repeat protein [Rhizobiaceae bacterium]